MDKFKTIADFPDISFIMAVIYSVASASPHFFSVSLFIFWLSGSAASYFAILRLTGKKRIFHSLTALGFSNFILSLFLASMNSTAVEVLNGYWVIFYALMTVLAYLGLSFYKN